MPSVSKNKSTVRSRARGESVASPAPTLPEFITPPSNTGVNNGQASKGVSSTVVVGYKALPSSRKLSKLAPGRKPADHGRVVRGQFGQFAEKTPLTDARLFSEVLEFQRAFEKVESLLRSMAAASPLQDRKVPLGVADYLRLCRGVIAQHTDISDEPVPPKSKRRS